jgi:hypothetical protein
MSWRKGVNQSTAPVQWDEEAGVGPESEDEPQAVLGVVLVVQRARVAQELAVAATCKTNKQILYTISTEVLQK